MFKKIICLITVLSLAVSISACGGGKDKNTVNSVTITVSVNWIINISHDLKTPLATIKGYGELLLEPEFNLKPEEKKKYSEVILNKSNYINRYLYRSVGQWQGNSGRG